MRGRWLEADEALVRRMIVELGHDPAPLERGDIEHALVEQGNDVANAIVLLVVHHNLRRAEPEYGDTVPCVACRQPIVDDAWALVDCAAFHTACYVGLRRALELPATVRQIRKP